MCRRLDPPRLDPKKRRRRERRSSVEPALVEEVTEGKEKPEAVDCGWEGGEAAPDRASDSSSANEASRRCDRERMRASCSALRKEKSSRGKAMLEKVESRYCGAIEEFC